VEAIFDHINQTMTIYDEKRGFVILSQQAEDM